MRPLFLPVIFSALSHAQTAPIRLDPINVIPPAMNADGSTVLFGAAVDPDGAAGKATNLYSFTAGTVRRLTNFGGESSFSGVTRLTYATGLAGYSALPAGPPLEEVHVVDTATGADRTVASDKESCIQPLCVNCFRSCIQSVHLTSDSRRVLYSVARNNGFYTVASDGTGLSRLSVYVGALADSPQRVISTAGQVVFTSSAPFGPTFAAAATDVHLMNLDGTGIRQVTRLGDARLHASNATISADGALIAYEQGGRIYTIRADGAGLRQISSGDGAAVKPSISADGSVVVFQQGGQLMREKDGSVLTLTKLSTSAAQDAVVSDDGRYVAFTIGPPFGTLAAVYRIPTDTTTALADFTPVYTPRALNPSGVANASPGSLISVYGVNLTSVDLTQAASFPLPRALDGMSLLVNGEPVPLVAATPWQINAQLPQTIPTGTARFEVSYSGGARSPAVTAVIRRTAPSIIAIVHAGTGVRVDQANPAAPGETVEIFALGLGVTDPVAAAGMPSPVSPLSRVLAMPRVQIAGRDVAVLFAGLTPGLAGLYQVNLTIPSGLTPGTQSMIWTGIDGSSAFSPIAVR